MRYLRNYDGDTVTVDIPDLHPLIGSSIAVRLGGVDTPELRSKVPCEKNYAREAKALVEESLGNAGRIDLVNIKRDKYFRVVADITYDGISLKNTLMARGLGVAYDGGTKSAFTPCIP